MYELSEIKILIYYQYLRQHTSSPCLSCKTAATFDSFFHINNVPYEQEHERDQNKRKHD